MKRTCENCSRPLFDTDKVCWHCGQKQSVPTRRENPSEPTNLEQTSSISSMEDEPETDAEPAASALVLYYGTVTAVIILALLLTIRSLGLSPILVIKSSAEEGEWVSLSSLDKLFTIDIPALWDWQFQRVMPANDSVTEMWENDSRIWSAVAPWGDLAPDIEIAFVAQHNSSLVVIARSERISRLSAQQAVTSLQNENFDNLVVSEASLMQTGSAEEKVYFNLEHFDLPLKCDQYMVPASSNTYIVAACAPTESYNEQQEMFETVLDSFRTKTQ